MPVHHARVRKTQHEDGASIDQQGALALQVLRSMGLPEVMVAVQGAGSSLKERAAAKKQATAALECELPGDRKVLPPQLRCPCSTFPILQPSGSRVMHACLSYSASIVPVRCVLQLRSAYWRSGGSTMIGASMHAPLA